MPKLESIEENKSASNLYEGPLTAGSSAAFFMTVVVVFIVGVYLAQERIQELGYRRKESEANFEQAE